MNSRLTVTEARHTIKHLDTQLALSIASHGDAVRANKALTDRHEVDAMRVADLERHIEDMRTAISGWKERFHDAKRDYESVKAELLVARRETELTRQRNETYRGDAVQGCIDVARLGGMLDMVREMGLIGNQNTVVTNTFDDGVIPTPWKPAVDSATRRSHK